MKKICSIFLIVVFIHSLNAQNKKQFFDAFGLKGEVQYSGEWIDTLLPKKGLFQLKWRDYNQNNLKSYSVNGRLNNHIPDGIWQWHEAMWHYTIQAGNNLYPNFNATGNRHTWNANFSKGLPNGTWSFYSDSVNQSLNILKRKIAVRGTFNNGVLTGKFSINDYDSNSFFSLSGICDSNGIAQGTWTFQYKNNATNELIKEDRIYDKGVLVEVRIATKDTVTVNSFDLIKKQIQAVGNNEQNLNFRIGDYEFDEDGLWGSSQDLMKYYFNEFFLKGFKHEVFPYNFDRRIASYKKIEYPFSDEERNFISATDSLIKHYTSEINKRLDYRNMLINRGWSHELDIAIAFSETALRKFQITDSLLQRTALPMFTYKNRFDQNIFSWAALLNKETVVSGKFYDTVSTELPAIDFTDEDVAIFKSLNQYVLELSSLLNNRLVLIDASYSALQKEEELQQLEDLMSAKLKQLETEYATECKLAAVIYEKWIDNYLKSQFQVYSKTADYDSAKILGNRLLDKMDFLIHHHSLWEQIESLPVQLKKAYTQFLYNPYNGKHDIAYIPKKRFYAKITTELYPWMYGRFSEINKWDDFAAHTELSIYFSKDLLDFATVDNNSSKKTESRIRKEKHPEKSVRILHQFFRNK